MKIWILPLLFLTGCSSFGMVPKFPEVPENLVEECPKLNEVKNTNKMSDLLKVVTENYSKYHECSEKVAAWNKWYTEQKKNQESLNEKF